MKNINRDFFHMSKWYHSEYSISKLYPKYLYWKNVSVFKYFWSRNALIELCIYGIEENNIFINKKTRKFDLNKIFILNIRFFTF